TLFVGWFARHPTAFTDTVTRYQLYHSGQTTPVLNVTGHGLVERVQIYWDYFNPSLLFFNGGSQAVFTTREAGIFLLPFAALLPLGLYRWLARERTTIHLAVVAGFLTAPLAALVLNQGGEINRELEVVPFAVVLATLGMRQLWTARVSAPLRPYYAPAS